MLSQDCDSKQDAAPSRASGRGATSPGEGGKDRGSLGAGQLLPSGKQREGKGTFSPRDSGFCRHSGRGEGEPKSEGE